MSLNRVQPDERHQALLADLKALLAKYDTLSGAELLGIAAQLVGMIVAFQDQRHFTGGTVMEMVATNIEVGNRVAIAMSGVGATPAGRS